MPGFQPPIRTSPVRHRATATPGIAAVDRVGGIDGRGSRRIGPGVLPLFAAPGCRVVPFGFGRQTASVPRAEGEGQIPTDAVDGPALVASR